MTLNQRTALVTGAGRGIGEAIARELSALGARVIVSARTREDIERVASSLTATGATAVAIPADVTDETSVERLAQDVRREVGDVDILVNNAGAASSAPIHKLTLEEWNRLFLVNATGAFLTTRAFIPDMVARGRGRVVNVASVAGLYGAPYVAAYTASKHALVGLTRSVAAEVAKHGVTVNAVCPGYVDTPMTQETVENIVTKTGRTREEAVSELAKLSGHGRLVTTREVAETVSWLTSDGAASVNGAAITIDGGRGGP